jgi:hypothetical protein
MRTDTFLTPDELADLSGLERPSAIKRWLADNRMPFLEGADGWPRVLRAAMLARLGGTKIQDKPEPRLRLRHA